MAKNKIDDLLNSLLSRPFSLRLCVFRVESESHRKTFQRFNKICCTFLTALQKNSFRYASKDDRITRPIV
jgi:hypothetical protein